MSEQAARERIAEAAHEAIVESFGGLGWGEVYYEDGHKEAPDTDLAYRIADDIIAIVREALLSDEAVEKAVDSAGNEFVGVYADAEDMLTAALDAAFGTDDE